MSEPLRIAVIGGGISGLAAAFRISELQPNAFLRLFEASSQLGGSLRSHRVDDLLIEQGADNFITNVPWGLDLCRRLGMEEDLLTTDEQRRQAFVVHRGKLVKVPQGFLLMTPSRLGPILTTPLLSPLGKLRLLAEWFLPAEKSVADESLGSFVRRRFGREVFERLVQPLVGGIYTADPERLSLQATMPRFLEMERKHGSLIRGTMKGRNLLKSQESGARYGLFVAPRNGMASIAERIAEKLPAGSIRLNATIDRIDRSMEGRWRLSIVSSQRGEPMLPERDEFSAVIVALPAHRASQLLTPLDVELSELLGQIPYAGTSVVTLVYRRQDIGHPLDGFGFVVPAIENRQILAASFASNKYPGRAPEDRVLIRVFIGGACRPKLADLADDRLEAIAVTELAQLLEIHEQPLNVGIARWPRSMPQYHLGHVELVDKIELLAAKHSGLALAGNAYRGVGVPHCIHSGEQAAEKVLQLVHGEANPL